MVEFTGDDRQMLRELHAAIVGTLSSPGMGEEQRTLRRELDDHREQHVDIGALTAIAAAASTAAVMAHEQQRPHPPDRRNGAWSRLGYDSARSIIAGVGTVVFLGLLWLVAQLSVVRL